METIFQFSLQIPRSGLLFDDTKFAGIYIEQGDYCENKFIFLKSNEIFGNHKNQNPDNEGAPVGISWLFCLWTFVQGIKYQTEICEIKERALRKVCQLSDDLNWKKNFLEL